MSESSHNIWLSSGLSLLAAIVVFIVFVLPAEFGRDPTGLGTLMGVRGMSGYDVSALSLETRDPIEDAVEFSLYPFESIEYKYELNQGQAMLYQWRAGGEVVFDFHSEEKGTDPEDSVSFSVGRGDSERGSYVAPYDGKHGWYWENRSDEEVVVKLRTVGYAGASITYSAQGEFRRALSPEK
ncbi:MAG: hypothetical protein ACI9ON_001402 [Limisphaerales bacterium]|jgi:hypothetical protein